MIHNKIKYGILWFNICLYTIAFAQREDRLSGLVDEYTSTTVQLNMVFKIQKQHWEKSETPSVQITGVLKTEQDQSTIHQRIDLESNGDFYVSVNPLRIVSHIGARIENLRCHISGGGFYLLLFEDVLTSNKNIEYVFSKDIEYSIQKNATLDTDIFQFVTKNNTIFVSSNLENRIKQIMNAPDGWKYRDFAQWNQNNCLAVNYLDQSIDLFQRDSRTKLNIIFSNSDDALNSPEGLTIDNHGNIYIADWANHRIVVLNSDRRMIKSIGTYGENTDENNGQKALFMFPTRIAIEEPQIAGEDLHLIVTDWNGIKKIDSRGTYLDTILDIPQSDWQQGDFYAVYIKNYGDQSKIWVASQKGQIVQVIPK